MEEREEKANFTRPEKYQSTQNFSIIVGDDLQTSSDTQELLVLNSYWGRRRGEGITPF